MPIIIEKKNLLEAPEPGHGKGVKCPGLLPMPGLQELKTGKKNRPFLHAIRWRTSRIRPGQGNNSPKPMTLIYFFKCHQAPPQPQGTAFFLNKADST